jgi:hypothetical protein
MLPQIIDFLTPFDPSGYIQVSGIQLEQLVGGLAPNQGIGLFVVTTDTNGLPSVPNAFVNTKWVNYGWLRIMPQSSNSVLYMWNPNGPTDATLLNWSTAFQTPPGSITGSQIAALTITDANMFSVSWSKLPNGAAVGGALTGTMPNPQLNINSINGAAIVTATVLGGDGATVGAIGLNTITNKNVTITDANALIDSNIQSIAQVGGGLNPVGPSGKLKVGGASQILQVNAAGTQLTWFSEPFAVLSQTGLGVAGQIPQVNAGATALQWFSLPVTQSYSQTDPNNAGLPNNATATTFNVGFVPLVAFVKAKCLTAEADYNVGDEIPISNMINGVNGASGVSFKVSGNNVTIIINMTGGGTLKVLDGGGAAYTNMTRANWIFKVNAIG